jgi:pyrroline-5-carboxylate reductase
VREKESVQCVPASQLLQHYPVDDSGFTRILAISGLQPAYLWGFLVKLQKVGQS